MATFNERLQELLTDQQIDAIRFAAGLDRSAQIGITEMQRALRALILERDPSKRSEWEALLREINKIIDAGFGGIAEEQITSLQGFAPLAAEAAVVALNEAAGITLMQVPNRLSAANANNIIMGAPSADWWKGQAVRMQDNFARTARQGFVAGETTEQIVRNLVGQQARGDSPAVPGVIDISRRDARSLVHTSVQSVANEARREVFTANEDIIIGVRQVSTLDNRTTVQCMARDQKQWDRERKPVGHSIPYKGGVGHLHWGCRSVEVPVLKPLVINGVEVGGFRGSQRASMDGPVDGKLSFEDWLKTKPRRYLDEVLGDGRAALYQSGRITLSDLLDQRGNELTLDEVRAKVIGRAFEEAKGGGTHHGSYRQYIAATPTQLRSSIRSLEKQISDHSGWIDNPFSKLPAGMPAEQVAQYVERKWPKDRQRHRELIEIARRVQKERGDE
jgi:hypothetical protein